MPFAEGLFHGVLCSDAFHCFLQRAGSVREMLRVMASEGLLVLARFGNAGVAPREGYDLTVDGYARLVAGVPHKFVCESDLVKTYLEGRRADLDRDERPDNLRQEKWVSLVATRQTGVFRRGEPFGAWPHAVGQLRINPIYGVDRREADG